MSGNARTNGWKRAVGVAALVVVAVVALATLRLYTGRPASLPEGLDSGGTLGQAVAREAETGVPVVVFATAAWCGPCQVLKRNGLADERVVAYLSDHAQFVKLEDTVPEEREQIEQLGVMGYPTLAVIRDGRVVGRLTGAYPADALLAWLREHVPESGAARADGVARADQAG